jgi:outer membrane protein TolC
VANGTAEDGFMRGTSCDVWRLGRQFVVGLAAPALLSVSGVALAAEPAPAPMPVAATPAPAPAPLDLAACRQFAFERQPGLVAARASLAAAHARAEALEHLHLAALVQRDLPIRRKQAALGVQISEAALSQAEWDTRHDVTFTYLAAVYATEQLAVANLGVEDLESLREIIAAYLKDPNPPKDLSQRNVDQIDIALLVGKGRREEAVEGVERALSALREAMGVGCDYPVKLATNALPRVTAVVDKEQVVASALARRGEMTQAANVAQVTCFEIEAQKATWFPSARTFASGSDIHATPVPQGSHDDPYRPGGVGIEMPATINGHRSDRIEQARNYHDRAEAVVAKTHNLIALDAEQAYLRWLEASKKLAPFEEAATKADKLHDNVRKQYDPKTGKTTVDELLNAGLLATQTRLQANATRYQQLQALAALERVTAGGFNAGLDVAPPK